MKLYDASGLLFGIAAIAAFAANGQNEYVPAGFGCETVDILGADGSVLYSNNVDPTCAPPSAGPDNNPPAPEVAGEPEEEEGEPEEEQTAAANG